MTRCLTGSQWSRCKTGMRCRVWPWATRCLTTKRAARFWIRCSKKPITVVQATDDESQDSQFAGLLTDVLTHLCNPAKMVVTGSDNCRDLVTGIQMSVHHHSKVAHRFSSLDGSATQCDRCLCNKPSLLWIYEENKFSVFIINLKHVVEHPRSNFSQAALQLTLNA